MFPSHASRIYHSKAQWKQCFPAMFFVCRQTRKHCFLAMFPEGGQIRKHCFLAMSFEVGQIKKHYFLAMLPEGGQTRNIVSQPCFQKVEKLGHFVP